VLRRVVLALTAVVLTGCASGNADETPSASASLQGMQQIPVQPRPSFTLQDTDGKPFAFTATSGRPTFLFFGFTNCPDVCPTTMVDIQQAVQKAPADVQKRTYVVFVTTDLKTDTAPVIKRWLANFDFGAATVVGLRGTQAQIDAAQVASRIPIAEDEGRTHSAVTLLFGKDDYARVRYPLSNNQAQLMAHDLPLVG